MVGRRHVVAIVDDDPDMRDALDMLMAHAGFDTELFATADAFHAAAPTIEATCVLLDLHLGDAFGVDLVRRLRADGFALPVIFMTGSDDEATRAQALEVGCIACLEKPIDVERLMQAIAEAMETRGAGEAQPR